MALPNFTMRQLLEAGVHFGHQTHRWNPKMGLFIFGTRNKIHIIDLAQTVPLLHQALVTVSDAIAKGGRVLFVGTKRQASEVVADAARRCAQYYINHRWLGGTLTNWKTISISIRHLREIDELLSGDTHGLTKKELLKLTRERDKLERALGGIKDMGGLPDVLFVIDTNKEAIAVAEAKKLKIPVIAVVDTNTNPDPIDYPIPGNDDAGRAITLYCDLIARAALDGIDRAAGEAGVDTGEAVEPIVEPLPETEAGVVVEVAGEAAVSETPKVEPASETPKVEPASETPKVEPASETPKVEPASETPKAEPASETPKAEPASETPKAEPASEAAPVQGDGAETGTADGTAASAGGEETDGGAGNTAPAEAAYKGLDKPQGEPDDLKKINGVGPAIEKKFNEFGIFHFWQIADLGAEDSASIDEALNFKGRIERSDWIGQAKKLREEKTA